MDEKRRYKGIGKDQLSRIENGRVECKLEYIFVIAQYVDKSADYLLFGKEESKESNGLIEKGNIEKKMQIVRLLNEL